MKNLVIVLLSLVIVGGSIMAYGLIDSNMEDIAQLNSEIVRLNDELEQSTTKYEELSNQVYNKMNGKAYEITIEHDDELHTWKSEGGLLDSVMHRICNQKKRKSSTRAFLFRNIYNLYYERILLNYT